MGKARFEELREKVKGIRLAKEQRDTEVARARSDYDTIAKSNESLEIEQEIKRKLDVAIAERDEAEGLDADELIALINAELPTITQDGRGVFHVDVDLAWALFGLKPGGSSVSEISKTYNKELALLLHSDHCKAKKASLDERNGAFAKIAAVKNWLLLNVSNNNTQTKATFSSDLGKAEYDEITQILKFLKFSTAHYDSAKVGFIRQTMLTWIGWQYYDLNLSAEEHLDVRKELFRLSNTTITCEQDRLALEKIIDRYFPEDPMSAGDIDISKRVPAIELYQDHSYLASLMLGYPDLRIDYNKRFRSPVEQRFKNVDVFLNKFLPPEFGNSIPEMQAPQNFKEFILAFTGQPIPDYEIQPYAACNQLGLYQDENDPKQEAMGLLDFCVKDNSDFFLNLIHKANALRAQLDPKTPFIYSFTNLMQDKVQANHIDGLCRDQTQVNIFNAQLNSLIHEIVGLQFDSPDLQLFQDGYPAERFVYNKIVTFEAEGRDQFDHYQNNFTGRIIKVKAADRFSKEEVKITNEKCNTYEMGKDGKVIITTSSEGPPRKNLIPEVVPQSRKEGGPIFSMVDYYCSTYEKGNGFELEKSLVRFDNSLLKFQEIFEKTWELEFNSKKVDPMALKNFIGQTEWCFIKQIEDLIAGEGLLDDNSPGYLAQFAIKPGNVFTLEKIAALRRDWQNKVIYLNHKIDRLNADPGSFKLKYLEYPHAIDRLLDYLELRLLNSEQIIVKVNTTIYESEQRHADYLTQQHPGAVLILGALQANKLETIDLNTIDDEVCFTGCEAILAHLIDQSKTLLVQLQTQLEEMEREAEIPNEADNYTEAILKPLLPSSKIYPCDPLSLIPNDYKQAIALAKHYIQEEEKKAIQLVEQTQALSGLKQRWNERANGLNPLHKLGQGQIGVSSSSSQLPSHQGVAGNSNYAEQVGPSLPHQPSSSQSSALNQVGAGGNANDAVHNQAGGNDNPPAQGDPPQQQGPAPVIAKASNGNATVSSTRPSPNHSVLLGIGIGLLIGGGVVAGILTAGVVPLVIGVFVGGIIIGGFACGGGMLAKSMSKGPHVKVKKLREKKTAPTQKKSSFTIMDTLCCFCRRGPLDDLGLDDTKQTLIYQSQREDQKPVGPLIPSPVIYTYGQNNANVTFMPPGKLTEQSQTIGNVANTILPQL